MNPIRIFRALNRSGVKYCLIGRMAAAMFGLNVHTDDVRRLRKILEREKGARRG